ncbi:MAG: hypothetical protein QXJ14_03695 [Candidatus Aenigmatarchaeota archaeon]
MEEESENGGENNLHETLEAENQKKLIILNQVLNILYKECKI